MELSVDRISGGYYQASEENSPSPDYPSEVKTVKDSVEIDVVNKNLLNIANTEETTKGGITYSIKNGILKLNGTATANFDIQLYKNIKIKKGEYTHSSSYIQSGLYISLDNLGYLMISATVGKKRTFELTEDTTYKRYFIWIDKGTVLNNVEIKLQLEAGTTATDFVEHQSQSVIMPIQQEMLTGDYIKDVEHHEWKKLIFDENSDIECIHADGTFQFTFLKYIEGTGATTKVICNMAKYWNMGAWGENGCFVRFDGYFCILCKENEFGFNADMTTDEAITHFKTILANSKLIVYYKLVTPINLELTEEQKAIRKQKLYTYKNITNIDVSDELASIDVTYKKDLETMFNNIIKQMPSSTSDTTET